MVLGLFLGVFALLIIGGLVIIVSTDRKRKPFVLSASELAAATCTEGSNASQGAVELASEAISRVGGTGVSVGEGPVVVGWVGSPVTNIAKYQEYELLVHVSEAAERPAEFRCIVRPRFSSSLGGGSRSAELRDQLTREISAMSGAEPPSPD